MGHEWMLVTSMVSPYRDELPEIMARISALRSKRHAEQSAMRALRHLDVRQSIRINGGLATLFLALPACVLFTIVPSWSIHTRSITEPAIEVHWAMTVPLLLSMAGPAVDIR